MIANETQHGGDHYKTKYEHWDLVVNTGMGYFEGNATKYVSRWRKKGGIQDLRKAHHYVWKLRENITVLAPRRAPFLRSSVFAEVVRFGEANGLGEQELAIILRLALWLMPEELLKIEADLVALIEAEVELENVAPLTEENKHAPRANTPKAHGSGGFAI